MDKNTLYNIWDWTKKGLCGGLILSTVATYAFCPGKVSTADLNNDGREDIVVNYLLGEKIFLDDGKGNFPSLNKFYKEKQNSLERGIEMEKREVQERAKKLE